ncbi:MAG: glycine cleavage system protein GcvH [Candidatus Gastranaerophilales bacterium]|nr:glycine cleavage system protein GcvH [Candidatus Gastranaerophilales bacterium]
MSEGMLCSKSHEYVLEQDGKHVIGLTDYAVEQLGDIVFIELPEVGSTFAKNESFATVESVKAASEIYMPISGTITEINEDIIANPELLNEDPMGKAWLVRIDTDADELEYKDLLEYSDYREEVE